MDELTLEVDDIRPETEDEKKAREERAATQLKEIGYVSLKNRKSPMEILDAMEKSEGLQTNVCKLLDCSAREFRHLISADRKWGVAWQEMRKKLVSKAEGVMVDLLDSKSEKTKFDAAKYILDKLGGGDGYGSTGGIEVVVEPGTEEQATKIRAIFGIAES